MWLQGFIYNNKHFSDQPLPPALVCVSPVAVEQVTDTNQLCCCVLCAAVPLCSAGVRSFQKSIY